VPFTHLHTPGGSVRVPVVKSLVSEVDARDVLGGLAHRVLAVLQFRTQ
jgi:hypothetical protein